MLDYSFTFNPMKKGLRQILGDLETDIMELIWSKGSLTVRNVYEKISEDRDIAYTTVMTVMSRLSEKGILKKIKNGSAFLYEAEISKQEFTKSTVKKVMDSLLEDFTTSAVNQFLDHIEDDPKKIDELEKLIKEKRNKK